MILADQNSVAIADLTLPNQPSPNTFSETPVQLTAHNSNDFSPRTQKGGPSAAC